MTFSKSDTLGDAFQKCLCRFVIYEKRTAHSGSSAEMSDFSIVVLGCKLFAIMTGERCAPHSCRSFRQWKFCVISLP